MLKVLIKKQFFELFSSYFIDKKTGKARTKQRTAIFFGFFAVLMIMLAFSFFALASGIGTTVLNIGINWMYFVITGLIAIALGVFGSVFNTYASLYLPKDNELLLSLPIPVSTLLTARIFTVYLTSLMYSALFWLPSVIAFYIVVPLNALRIVYPLILTFAIAMFVCVLSCILGWVVALIASKTKSKSFITVILSLAVVVGYYTVYFKIVNSIGEILEKIVLFGDKVKSTLHYLYLLGRASDGDTVSMLLVVLITAILAAICFFILSKTFTKLASSGQSSSKNAKIKSKYFKKNVSKALLDREYKHFASIPTWILNGGLGLFIMPVAAIVMLIKKASISELLAELNAELPSFANVLPSIIAAAICLILSTNTILSVSVSIEKNTLWLIKSLPVHAWDILRVKEQMSVQLSLVASLILAIAACFAFGFGVVESLLVCCAVAVYAYLISDFGLFLNLKMPNMNWTNAAVLTKQSMPVFINLFGGWAFCVIVGAGGLFVGSYIGSAFYLAICTVLFAVLCTVLRHWLKTKGTKIFENL